MQLFIISEYFIFIVFCSAQMTRQYKLLSVSIHFTRRQIEIMYGEITIRFRMYSMLYRYRMYAKVSLSFVWE